MQKILNNSFVIFSIFCFGCDGDFNWSTTATPPTPNPTSLDEGEECQLEIAAVRPAFDGQVYPWFSIWHNCQDWYVNGLTGKIELITEPFDPNKIVASFAISSDLKQNSLGPLESNRENFKCFAWQPVPTSLLTVIKPQQLWRVVIDDSTTEKLDIVFVHDFFNLDYIYSPFVETVYWSSNLQSYSLKGLPDPHCPPFAEMDPTTGMNLEESEEIEQKETSGRIAKSLLEQ